jgi:hypothetical protein
METMDKNRDRNTDNFSEIIKNKLQNYSLPVEDSSWEEIEKQLETTKPEKKIALWPWIAGISVAASIAFIWLIPYNKQITDYDTTVQLPHHEETITESVFTEETLPLSHLPSVQNKPVSVRENSESGISEQLTLSEPDVIEQEPEKELLIAEKVKSPKKNPEKSNDLAGYWQKEEESTNFGRKKKTKSLGLHIGSGGSFYASNNSLPTSNGFYTDLRGNSKMALNAPELLKSEILSPDDFAQIIHRPPVSFGLSIRKELTNYLFIESGLSYTYLYSGFENKIPRQDAKLELHYVGIPVNVTAYLYPHRKWNIYASAGGMVEKGLLSHYVQNTYENNVAVKTKSDERIDGLQWSLQAAIGIDYKFSKEYSIFLEPKVNYYPDNNQPFNARTEHPLVLGINTGLRYTW